MTKLQNQAANMEPDFLNIDSLTFLTKRKLLKSVNLVAKLAWLSSIYLLSACNGDGDRSDVTAEAASSKFAIPSVIRSKPFPEQGTLKAYAVVDGGDRQEMSVNGDNVEVTLRALSLGEHSFKIIFEFTGSAFGDVIRVATSIERILNVSSGGNQLSFLDEDYITDFDDDEDGMSNLDELAASRNPLVFDDVTLPLAGVSFPPLQGMTLDESVLVRGVASDEHSALSGVTVNGVEASSDDGFATWSVEVPLAHGDNSLQVEVVDAANNRNESAVENFKLRRVEVFLERPLDVVYEESQNRLLVLDALLEAVISIDLTTGAQTLLFGDAEPRIDGDPSDFNRMVLDTDNNRVLITESGDIPGILAVDLATGSSEYLSRSGGGPGVIEIVGDGPSFVSVSDIALDTANNRALVVSPSESSVFAVDLDSGSRTVFASSGEDEDQQYRALAVDSANGRALLFSQENDGVVTLLDLETGVSNFLVTNSEENYLSNPTSAAIDSVNNRALIVNNEAKVLVAMDLDSGEVSLLSGLSTPISTSVFSSPKGVYVDAANGRALVADDRALSGSASPKVFAVDLSSGERSTISNGHILDRESVIGIPSDIAIDSRGDRLLAISGNDLYAIGLADGSSEQLLADFLPNSTGEVSPLGRFTRIDYDDENDRAILLYDDSQSLADTVVGLDLSTGNQAFVSSQFGPAVDRLAYDAVNERALVVDSGADLLSIPFDGSDITILSNNFIPNDSVRFVTLSGVAVDSANNRAVVSSDDSLISVNLLTGVRSVFSNSNTPNTENPLAVPSDLAIDTNNSRAIVIDAGQAALVAVDLATGLRSVFSDSSITRNSLVSPISIDIDEQRNWALVTDSRLDLIYAIDLEDGQRVILSR